MNNRISSLCLPILFVNFFLVAFSFSENVPGKLNSSGMFPVFNVRLGTQTFDPKYQFTSDTKLLETAKQIYEMGSDIIKLNFKATMEVALDTVLPPMIKFNPLSIWCKTNLRTGRFWICLFITTFYGSIPSKKYTGMMA